LSVVSFKSLYSTLWRTFTKTRSK